MVALSEITIKNHDPLEQTRQVEVHANAYATLIDGVQAFVVEFATRERDRETETER
jgi:hypothetical protein